jgi:hypothetical protein
VSEVDPDPNEPAEGQGRSTLGGRDEPGSGDPTDGGRRGAIGEAPSIAADEPDDGGPALAPGGGHVDPGSDQVPASAGPDEGA